LDRFLRPGGSPVAQESGSPLSSPGAELAPGFDRSGLSDRLSVALGAIIGFAGLAVLWASFAGRL